MKAVDVLPDVLQAYHQQVDKLNAADTWETQEREILILLRQRDRIQQLIDQLAAEPEGADLSIEVWQSLAKADRQVGKWNDRLLALEPLPIWRKSLHLPEHHWWWFPQKEDPKPILGWLLGGLTIALLTMTLALAKDIATRFLTGAPGVWSSVGAIVPVVLALLATGGVLTKVGQQLIDAYLNQRLPYPRYWPLVKCSLALGLLVLFFIAHRAGLPWAAAQYHALGARQYFDEGKLSQAQANFERSLRLNPDFPKANHDLALTYEDLRDLEQAKAEYAKAIKGGYLESVNNLARLQILEDEDYESAAVLLISVFQDKRRDLQDYELKYGLHKNLGWAWLKQDRLPEAEGELIKAIRLENRLNGSRPDAHCLLAEVYEKQQRQAEALAEWTICRDTVSRPEDDLWLGMANKALSRLQEQP